MWVRRGKTCSYEGCVLMEICGHICGERWPYSIKRLEMLVGSANVIT